MSFDVDLIRKQFPITEITFDLPCLGCSKPLVYLDHGASTHPPREVLDRYRDFIENSYANIHRGLHSLSMVSTDLFEHVSHIIKGFIGADFDSLAVVYTQNTTEALDLASHVMAHLPGAVLTTEMEHHSNDLPHRSRGDVYHARVTDEGRLDLEHMRALLTDHDIKLVAVTAASNVTGFMPDIHAIAEMAHAHGARIVVDGAQILAHHPMDVRSPSDPGHIDFFAAAGHKAYAPFGSAFLVGPRDVLAQAPPYRAGGGTVVHVTLDDVGFLPTEERHQGGTPNIPGVIALACSLEFLDRIGMQEVREHELELLRYCLDRFRNIDGLEIYGPDDPEARLGVVSFNIDGVHHSQVSAILNNEAAIATRNGCFCAHPYIYRLLRIQNVPELIASLSAGVCVQQPGAVRASFGVFNTEREVDELVKAVLKVRDRDWHGDYEIQGYDHCKPEFYSFSFAKSGQEAPSSELQAG